MRSALVLFSGGQDSTTALYWALSEFDRVATVSIDYGQRHATELEAARTIAGRIEGVQHTVLKTSVFQQIGNSALLDKEQALTPDGGYADAPTPAGLPSSFVPARNLIFLSLVGAVAVRMGIKNIVTGMYEVESVYPDVRRAFVDAAEKALSEALPSSVGPIKIHTPLMRLRKSEVVALAASLPGCMDALAFSITCYDGLRGGCGKCPACKTRARGFREAGIVDPATL